LPALALTTDTSTLTSVGNDYGFQAVFARQIQALAVAGDVLIAISTSGRSENVLRGVAAAAEQKVFSIGFLGKGGGQIAELVNLPLVVPGSDTARIQEAHITMGHILCEFVDLAWCSHV
jgi:D-sedoheptulose 7-phosphate isomerase